MSEGGALPVRGASAGARSAAGGGGGGVDGSRWQYATSPYIARQEGQVSVGAGEALEVLESDNGYWWLVRAVATDEVGYMPSGQIEVGVFSGVVASVPLPLTPSLGSK
jgi:hypothetical protein